MKKFLFIALLSGFTAAAQYGPADSVLQAQIYRIQDDLMFFKQERSKASMQILAGIGVMVIATAQNYLSEGQTRLVVPLYLLGGGLTLSGSIRYHRAHRRFKY
jgi:hypothetical protein